MDLESTIAAIASPPGAGERGIIRISGPDLADRITDFFSPGPAEGTRAIQIEGEVQLGPVPCPASLYFWPDSRSYTGQPSAELHLPGSPPLIESAVQRVFTCGIRPARPGEFTLRAFLAGKVDLAQAEAVLGVIDAFDHEELNTALRQLAGSLSGQVIKLRNELADLLADLEAGLDFVEEDIEFISNDDLLRRLADAINSIDVLLMQVEQRSQSTGVSRVVLAGLPNAGKSTLFNALTADDSAIVSNTEGTTRDYVSRRIDCDGVPVELIDTAGREFQAKGIGDLAQQHSATQMEEADLIVWCSPADLDERGRNEDEELRRRIDSRQTTLTILTRCDLQQGVESGGASFRPVSAISGEGLTELVSDIAARLSEERRGTRHFVGSTAARSSNSLTRARDALRNAEGTAASGAGDELTSIEIRGALDSLGEIVGAVYTEDLLDRVFSRFCIGK